MHADKTEANKSHTKENTFSSKQSESDSSFSFVDNRPEAAAQRKLQAMVNNNPDATQLKVIQAMFTVGKPPSPEEKRRKRRRAIERRRERQQAAERRRREKFQSDTIVLPSDAILITIDPFSVEVGLREVSDHKTRAYGIKVKVPGGRLADFGSLSGNLITALAENSTWYKADDLIWAKITGDMEGVIKFNTSDAEQLEKALCIKYLILNEEAQPRSGKGRAAPNDDDGGERQPAKNEAMHASAKHDLLHKDKDETPQFTAEHKGNTIEATITHTSHWAKGVRDPGQSDVMGGQNAKNYIVDTLNPPADPDQINPFERKRRMDELGGRWEWLHLIGSSLGGLNTANNLVAGSYDANTKMIPLEHRVANWGNMRYDKEFKPTPENPIEIKTIATVDPDHSHVGDQIRMTVKHGDNEVVRGDYNAKDKTVITKDQYDTEEQRVGTEIEEARPKV